MKIEVDVDKRIFYVFLTIFIIFISAIIITAVAPGDPVPFGGHDISQIAPPAGCQPGNVLKKTTTGWTCSSYGGGWGNPTITRYINDKANLYTGYDSLPRPYDSIISDEDIIGPHDVCFVQKITEGESNDRDGFFLYKLSDGRYKYDARVFKDNQAVIECLTWD